METKTEVSRPIVTIEVISSISRKMTVQVPAQVVNQQINRGLAEAQKTANLKGFRPGHAPISMIRQQFGDDIRHRVLHHLIDESFEEAIETHQLRVVGQPQFDTPHHQTGEGSHDHQLIEDEDLTFIASFEVMPEVKVGAYTGISVSKSEVQVTDGDVSAVIDGLRQSQAQLVPVATGLILSDGTHSSRAVQIGDFVDIRFSGGLVTEAGVQPRDDMKGSRILEVGSKNWIPGFEDELVGMSRGQTKTFQLRFPETESPGEFAGQLAEFTVTVDELKEKKLPESDEEWLKQMGYETLQDLHHQAREHLLKERKEEVDRKMKNDILAGLIEKNPFDIPKSLVEAQTKALVQDLARDFKSKGYTQEMLQEVLAEELEQLKKRAEGQVRASLVLESIAQQEGISVTPEELENEIDQSAQSMNLERAQLADFYDKNPAKKDDLEFRLRQERTLQFLLKNAHVNLASSLG